MYKIKLFRNMAGLSAGKSLRQTLTNKDWWKGVFGNMLSTMLGIALTVGVAALVEHHNDKKLAREMMFNIAKVCEKNGAKVQEYDSVFQAHAKAADKMTEIYYKSDKFKNLTEEQADTFRTCWANISCMELGPSQGSNVGKYFYSSQMMHQFGNANIYATFALFVQTDQNTLAIIDKLYYMWIDLMADIRNNSSDPNADFQNMVAELMEQHKFTNYSFQINASLLSSYSQAYKDMLPSLLKEMNASKEDFEDYKKSIDTGHTTVYEYKKNF